MLILNSSPALGKSGSESWNDKACLSNSSPPFTTKSGLIFFLMLLKNQMIVGDVLEYVNLRYKVFGHRSYKTYTTIW